MKNNLIIIILITGLLISCANCQPEEEPLLDEFEPFDGGPDKILAWHNNFSDVYVIDSSTDEVIRKFHFSSGVGPVWASNYAIFFPMDNGIYVSTCHSRQSVVILDSKNGTCREILKGENSIAHAYPLDGTRLTFLGAEAVAGGKAFYILDTQEEKLIYQDAFVSTGFAIDVYNNNIIAFTDDTFGSESNIVFSIDSETYNRETIFVDPIEGSGTDYEEYYTVILTEDYWYTINVESAKDPLSGEAYLYKYDYDNVQIGARQKILETITDKPRCVSFRYKNPSDTNIIYLRLVEKSNSTSECPREHLIKFNLGTMLEEDSVIIQELNSITPYFFGMANGKIYLESWDNTEDLTAGVTKVIDCSDFSNITKIYPDNFPG